MAMVKTLTQDELSTLLAHAQKQVEVGALYNHYRNPGQIYAVLAVAIQESSHEISVVYQARYGAHTIWVRPLSNWLEEVDHQGKKFARFQRINTH